MPGLVTFARKRNDCLFTKGSGSYPLPGYMAVVFGRRPDIAELPRKRDKRTLAHGNSPCYNRSVPKREKKEDSPKRPRGRPETRVLKIKGTPEQVARAIFAAAKPKERTA